MYILDLENKEITCIEQCIVQAGVCVSDRDEITLQSNQKIPREFMSEENELYDTIGNQPRSDRSYTCIYVGQRAASGGLTNSQLFIENG